MKPVHVGPGTAGAPWDTFMGIIRDAADERGVDGADQKGFLALFEKQFRPVLVEKP